MNTDFMLSMNTNSKIARLQNAWQQRLASGDMTAKRDLYSLQPVTGAEDDDQGKLQQIHAKLQYGGKLTEKERDYLKTKDPKTYSDLMKEEEEQKSYERSLRLCRTQEDVQSLKLSRIARSLSAIKEAERDSSLSKEEKMQVAVRELRTLNHAIKSTDEFARSAAFRSLPCCAAHSGFHFNAEEKLRYSLKERMEQLLSRSSQKIRSRYDTFIRSGTSTESEDTAARRVKALYDDVDTAWQNSVSFPRSTRL